MTNLVFSIISFLTARFDRTDKGEVSIEYVMVGGLAALAIIAGMAVLFPAVGGWFQTITDTVNGAI